MEVKSAYTTKEFSTIFGIAVKNVLEYCVNPAQDATRQRHNGGKK